MESKMSLGECLCKRYEQLDADRGNWKDYWSKVTRYVNPSRDNVYGERTAGQKQNTQVFDATAIRANRDYANAMVSLLMNPSTKWFMFSTGNPDLDTQDDVHKWLDKETKKTLDVLAQSNFYVSMHEMFLDDGAIGTSAVVALKDDDTIARFETQPIFEWVIAENEKRVVDVGHRKYKLTCRQLIQMFGEELLEDKDISKDYKTHPDKKYEIIQAIEPRENLASQYPEVEKATQNPFVSVHVLKIKKRVLKIGGFSSNPLVVSRHSKESGELYGRSLGMEAFPEIMTANQLRKIILVGGQLAVAPPMQATDNAVMRGVKLRPYGMTYRRPGSDPIEPLFTGARPDIGQELLDSVRNSIEQFFYLDQLRTVQSDRMTATEIMQRRDEQFRSLAAVLIRKDQELCKPVIERVFRLRWEAGDVSEPPAALAEVGGNISIVYNSMIAKAMQMAEAENFTIAMGITEPLFSMDPQVVDNIDADKGLRKVFKTLGVDAEFLRNETDRDELREQRAEEEAQQQQMMAEQEQSQTEKNLAEAERADPSV